MTWMHTNLAVAYVNIMTLIDCCSLQRRSHPAVFVGSFFFRNNNNNCLPHGVIQGSMMKHLEEHILQSNMTRNDVMLYYTTVSSILWLSQPCAGQTFTY